MSRRWALAAPLLVLTACEPSAVAPDFEGALALDIVADGPAGVVPADRVSIVVRPLGGGADRTASGRHGDAPEIPNLQPGQYIVGVEGWTGNFVAWYDERTVEVSAGQTTEVTATTADFQAPTPLASPSPVQAGQDLSLTWAPVSKASRYIVELSPTGGDPTSHETNQASIKLPLGEGAYSARVRAINRFDSPGLPSGSVSFTVLSEAPTNLTATVASSSQINLAWNDNSSNETGFRIERCAGPSCVTFAEIATVGANVITHQNTGLTAGTSYTYRVRAYNAGGNSSYSNSASATTPPVISLNRQSLSFTYRDLGFLGSFLSPLSTVVEITNPGGGILSGLSSSIAYQTGRTGWLDLSLNRTTAPANLTVIADRDVIENLPNGKYTATVTIRSSVAGVASREVEVTLDVF